VLFPTVTFAIFFAVVLPMAWSLANRRQTWMIAITAASCVFYGWHLWHFLWLLGASVVANWVLGNAVGRAAMGTSQRRWMVRAAVAANLGLLGWFKYAGFFTTSLINGANRLGVDLPFSLVRVGLPIGISFFTFHALSYVIDIGRGGLQPASFLEFATYMCFFPHLVAGPIVRGSELIPQLQAPRSTEGVDLIRAARLILFGLVKKVVISSYLASALVDRAFTTPAQLNSLQAVLGMYGYAAQIYADFSGYTDIAIGVALLLGFRFPENFDAPYTATSLQDFWRRWHMTLSRWLRDYLYIPLGGNRNGTLLTYRNLALTMVLGGLWHGASWTFVIWGALHGGGLVVERLWSERRGNTASVQRRPWLRRFVTFHFVCLAWVFFRADSFGTAMTFLSRILTGGWGTPGVHAAYLLALAGIGAQFVRPARVAQAEQWVRAIHPAAQVALMSIGLVTVSTLGPEGVAPFIYFRF
jgi:alginate O-acetyltransferase complex protein AlgI